MSWYGGYGTWKPYVPVAQRKANAAKYAASLAKKEKRTLAPVTIEGRKIAKSFWGMAWCDNLEQYSDYANRLPRGGTYVRNGSVIDLQIRKGLITALVSGSDVYTVEIEIETLPNAAWKKIKQDCSRSIDSLLELLQGKFDRGIMERLTHREAGLFPKPKEISLDCSCPDSAGMCKHIAAVMYGVGNRLDSNPELLFLLRAVDHLELIGEAASAESLDKALTSGQNDSLAGSDLSAIFGIELDMPAEPTATRPSSKLVVPVAKKLKVPRKGRSQKPAKSAAAESAASGRSQAGILKTPAEASRAAKPAKARFSSSGAKVASAVTSKTTRAQTKSTLEKTPQKKGKAVSQIGRQSPMPVAEVLVVKKTGAAKASTTKSAKALATSAKHSRVRKVSK